MLSSTRLVALAAAGSLAVALAGCTTDSNADGTGDKLRVVATTTQLADFTAQIGGDDIELTGLLAPGASAHSFDPTPADLIALGSADALIINGGGLDEFIDSAIESSGFDGVVIDASEGINLETAREITAEALEGQNHDGEHEHANDHGHSHGEDGHAHDGDTADAEADAAETEAHADAHEDHAHEEEGDHDHAHDHGDQELNPHLWTSPRFAQGMVSYIAEQLGALDPQHSEAFFDRAGEYNAQLVTLDDWIADQFDRVPASDRVLVTGHDSLRYYLHDYDIAYVGSLLPSFDDNAEPSAAEIDALVAAIKAAGVKAIFVESSLSPKLAQTVAQQAGITVVDEESLFVDSLGPEGSGATSYLAATVHNTRVILDAWGANVDELPAGIDLAESE